MSKTGLVCGELRHAEGAAKMGEEEEEAAMTGAEQEQHQQAAREDTEIMRNDLCIAR